MLFRVSMSFIGDSYSEYLVDVSTRQQAIENCLQTFLKGSPDDKDHCASSFLLGLRDTGGVLSVNIDEFPTIGKQPVETNYFSNRKIRHRSFCLSRRTNHYGVFAIKTAKNILGKNWKRKVLKLKKGLDNQWMP